MGFERKLGISIYPDKTKFEDNINYIKLASKYGFDRVFTCLLSPEGDVGEIKNMYKNIISICKENKMEVILDVAPNIFEKFGISYNDLSFFNEMGADGIRLDLGFTGNEESLMTFNPYDLKIELNISTGTKYLENILCYHPNRKNLIGCHNFYPRRNCGLSYEQFEETSMNFKKNGLRIAAFVSSDIATIGPWPVTEGLCTLEMHRDLPIEVQAKHLWATGLVDDVIIANCFASEEDMKKLSEINRYLITFDVDIVQNIPEIERKIMFEELHCNRGDTSEHVIRSSQSRVKYKGNDFKVFNPQDIKRGDITIDSSQYGTYAGELHVARLDMKNTGKTNIVGKIRKEEIFILDNIKPWMKFKLKERK